MNTTLNLTAKQVNIVKSFYIDYQVESKNQYIVFFAKQDNLVISIYSSNKVVLQGKDSVSEYKMWLQKLNIKTNTKPTTKKNRTSFDSIQSQIGSDEVGTGDVFGPVVVVSCFVDEENIPKLKDLGVRDSKDMKDSEILKIAKVIKELVIYTLIIVDNKKYNALQASNNNMNKIKALMHNTAILKTVNKIDKKCNVILDQFCSKENYFKYLKDEELVYKDILFHTKAESKFISVAAASILARATFVIKFDELSRDTGYDLLKGANAKVDLLLKRIIDEKGESYLTNIAKMNFKNIDKAKKL